MKPISGNHLLVSIPIKFRRGKNTDGHQLLVDDASSTNLNARKRTRIFMTSRKKEMMMMMMIGWWKMHRMLHNSPFCVSSSL